MGAAADGVAGANKDPAPPGPRRRDGARRALPLWRDPEIKGASYPSYMAGTCCTGNFVSLDGQKPESLGSDSPPGADSGPSAVGGHVKRDQSGTPCEGPGSQRPSMRHASGSATPVARPGWHCPAPSTAASAPEAVRYGVGRERRRRQHPLLLSLLSSTAAFTTAWTVGISRGTEPNSTWT